MTSIKQLIRNHVNKNNKRTSQQKIKTWFKKKLMYTSGINLKNTLNKYSCNEKFISIIFPSSTNKKRPMERKQACWQRQFVVNLCNLEHKV
jgi:hypothetical protein